MPVTPDIASNGDGRTLRPHVLVVGGSGVFGSRLARLLARRRAFVVTLGGRDPAKAAGMQEGLLNIDPEGGYRFATIDRDRADAAALRQIGCHAVVDCSGPFQKMGPSLIAAAIGAGCHYVDLADSRAFVADIGRVDSLAQAADVAVISGASSTPSLSNAVLDSMLAGWISIDTIDCAIFPGNQTPKGPSVIRGILSWVGQPLLVLREGGWQADAGWRRARTVSIPGIDRRRVRLANVPDLDILPARFAPRLRASFDAGMELMLLNGLIDLAGVCVRWRLVPSATIFTGIGTLVANGVGYLGSADGGMLVQASGVDGGGVPRRVRWHLMASGGDGPYVPVGPAAALLEKMLLAGQIPTGARNAAGLLTLAEIKPHYSGLAIQMVQTTLDNEQPLYHRIMGHAFAELPETTRRIHRGLPAIVAHGEAEVIPSRSLAGRLLARCFGMPTGAGKVPIRVIIEDRDGREYWTRVFGDTHMRSTMRDAGDHIEERFGPVAIRMRLVGRSDGLDMVAVGGSLFGVPLPRFVLPNIKAQERVGTAGQHLFDVDIGLPFIGRVVAYRGSLAFD